MATITCGYYQVLKNERSLSKNANKICQNQTHFKMNLHLKKLVYLLCLHE